MARKVLGDAYYTFTPSTRTIVIPRVIPRERIILITNVTSDLVIFNFSDPNLRFTSYTTATTTSPGTTTIVLAYNTVSMSATDKLQIIIDEYDEKITPSEVFQDPVSKLRISSPQALIDTDFEYGTQSTKWESIGLVNNRPLAFYNTNSPLTFTDVTATNNSRTVTVATTTPPAAGTTVFIQDTNWTGADGLYVVDTVSAGVNFTYTARIIYTGTTGSINVSGVTTIYTGSIFTGASIGLTSITFSSTTITVTTSIPHGLSVGNEIALTGTSASTNAPNGSWIVATVTSPTVFVFYATSAPTGSVTGGTLYVRPLAAFLHRPFDGGVTFSTNALFHNTQAIRQTRRYFRYQSGKGIQMSTGTLMKPNINIDQITSSGTTVTVTTKTPHNVNPGVTIVVANANETAYNGTFTVATVLNPYQFTYTAASTPTSSPASGLPYVSINSWFGSTVRVGLFDSQNGVFFEFDGQTLYAVRRASTYQISGVVSVNAGSCTVTGQTVNGVTTLFAKQLTPGDFIVIKGMTYRVMHIASDTSMTINPAYRGSANLTNAVVSKTIDTRIAQSTWNIDRCDGTGPSGYTIDLTKMQMFYIDYSWYGAGFIRWGFRATDGNIVYAHKVANNNVNYEAYMRSGNLPARYETASFAKMTVTTGTFTNTDTVLNVSNTTEFPSSGILWVRNGTQSEFVNYTGKTSTTFTGITRTAAGASLSFTLTSGSVTATGASTSGIQVGQFVVGTGIQPGTYVVSFVTNTSVTLSAAATASGAQTLIFAPLGQTTAQTFTFSAVAPTVVELHAPTYAPVISHWGTSVIMDGRFDDDKSFVFTLGTTSTLQITAAARNCIQSFRIAPVVQNGIGGLTMGSRELINRMQMVLRQMSIFSNGQFLITLVLNGTVSSATPNWQNVGGSSLAQYINHNAATTITGGETIYGFYADTAGGASFATTGQDLTLVRDLGSSILGGGAATANTNIYPDGPDVVTIVAQNIGSTTANIASRISWTEAQA